MRNYDYRIISNGASVNYNDVIEQVKSTPKEFLGDISKYIAFLMYCSEQAKAQEKSPKPGLREFVGSIKIDRDPLEIQKELRDEWM